MTVVAIPLEYILLLLGCSAFFGLGYLIGRKR